MITKTKETPNYNSITKVIKVVKQVFNVNQQKEDEDNEDEGEGEAKSKKKNKKKKGNQVNIGAILGSA